MTGKVFDGNPTPAAFLILILPLAAIIVLLYKAWIWILGFVALVIVWKLVDNYQWQRWSEKINPIFNQLIQENQGQVTPMDLSLKANLSAGSAKRFLARKAEEFSATSRELPEQGKVYYFITASTLGSILDDSEPVAEEPEEPETFDIDDDDDEDIEIPPNNQVTSQPSEVSSPPSTTSLSSPFAQLAALKEERMQQEDQPSEVASSPSPTETPQPPPEQLTPTPPPETTPSENTSPDSDKKEKFKLIQSDLAKRLDTTPSTIGRRKSDDSFAEWSQSKDPDGIAWKYLRKSRVFIPVDPDKRYV
ncbi:MAG: hypothetical protein MK111_03810 [Crocosphaera sp.]|uniref:Uncharacterized protein n=4 Tax=Crocosphaera watsonii TaxID=263511 RepID=G5J235_CROWT|nr:MULTISPECIES: hypothetical protein [Crocosphaera]EHJ13750.1 hypothetical protein CWATWH0003_1569 [Crocosphaera watsonii WH 0003]MCH2243754.1 hypothetical protein [Crocosphaera sp.]CCQ57406.1 hypothetical protein CWATWH0005_5719 [Crocosphaera watsonii WH 0005]CCQ64178.1 hypothetical protein CWATWH0401_37 [Crocosphaera watsonii WH 0401]